MTRWVNDSLRGASLVAGLVALGLLYRTFGLEETAAAFSRLRPTYLLAYLSIACVVRLGYSVRWRLVARVLSAVPGLARFVAARLAGDAVSSLIPSGGVGGDPLRIALVYADGLGGPKASAGVAIDRLMEVTGNMLCAVAYVTAFWFTHAVAGSPRAPVVLIATLLLLLLCLAIPMALLHRGVRPFTPLVGGWLLRATGRAREWAAALARTEDCLIQFFHDRPFGFLWGLLGSLLIEATIILEYHCLLSTFRLEIDLPTLLAVLVASGLVRAVPVPAALGALEASQVTLIALANGRPGLGFVVGMVLRLHETLWTAVGLAALSVQGLSIARMRLWAAGKVAG